MNKYKVMIRPTYEKPLTIEAASFYVDKERTRENLGSL